MRTLVKGAVPGWLQANGAAKTQEYKDAADKKPTPWRNAEIVAALEDECAKKCMYCEATIDVVAYAAVEHIRPKSRFEDLVLAWSNLGLVCPKCNTNKGDYWSDEHSTQLLNPYEDVLEEHLRFQGPMVTAKLGSLRGEVTVNKIQLSREGLVWARAKRIQELHRILALWASEQNADRKSLFVEEVERAVGDDQEFTGTLRAYATQQGFPVEGVETVPV
ncbi:HNH endonuclease [Leucobacter allii]|uniref:HNH endonuclease signature motif containing protein n=1 Tax=Leucobacter allii TaxID=2932247 RepID=UPI001FD2542C|nr:HNH endonuclease signature motif containing protein [Leucobacter allii]UOR00396.1 HNH endonuclease [Leucobacter allii]